MKYLVLSAVFLVACGKTIDAQCNACGTATYTAAECTAAGAAAQCKTSVLQESTDSACAPNGPPTTHLACLFTGCTSSPNCAL